MKHKKLLAAAFSLCLSASMTGMAGTANAANIMGDVNNDGNVSVADLVIFQRYLMGADLPNFRTEKADLNGDGSADTFDFCIMRDKLKNSVQAEPSLVYTARNITEDIKSSGSFGAAADEEFIHGQTEFALSLFKKNLKNENTLISPYSVMQALAMTANGANGNTKAEMETVLGGMPMERLNNYLYTLRMNQLNIDKCKLSTANSIWGREDVEIKNKFLQTAVDYYNADFFKAPFDDTTKNDINNWVNEKTDEMIPEILDEINPDAVVYLVNAVAFDAKWETEFEKHQTFKYDFHAADGTVSQAEMMNSYESYFISDENAKGIYKYYSGRKYAFAAVLPNEGISVNDYISGLTADSLHELLSNVQEISVETRLPKFSYDDQAELKETLAEMGMPTAFEAGADFTNMADRDMAISRVIHKTHIDVDEGGTKAAAATLIEVNEGCIWMPEDIDTVIFDRPFFYCIVDTETNIPVFMGTLSEISE